MLRYQDFIGELQHAWLVMIITRHHLPVQLPRRHSVAQRERVEGTHPWRAVAVSKI